jgi:hypothetical protein
MVDPSRPYKPTRFQLFLECAQREMTYLPLAASALLVGVLPEWAPTWVLAPLLFTGGGAHFIYDFLMGEDVRNALAARMERREEAARDTEIGELKQSLPEGDAKAVLAARAREGDHGQDQGQPEGARAHRDLFTCVRGHGKVGGELRDHRAAAEA